MKFASRTPVAREVIVCAAFLTMTCSQYARAEVTFDWSLVSLLDNAADRDHVGAGRYGAVDHAFRISRQEVTNDQYSEFLNAVAKSDPNAIYDVESATDPRAGILRSGANGSYTYEVKPHMGDKPANYVSFFNAMRFVNWFSHGQPVGPQGPGTTEAGVYTIGSGLDETRAAGAQYFLPSEDEWYKAAYFDPRTAAEGGPATDDHYWMYATQSDAGPAFATAGLTGDIGNPGVNIANRNEFAHWNGELGNVTTVGSAGPLSESYFGTSDQAGNVWEWNESIVDVTNRGIRGGSWEDEPALYVSAALRGYTSPLGSSATVGFRVASVPEPSSLGLLVPVIAFAVACKYKYKRLTCKC